MFRRTNRHTYTMGKSQGLCIDEFMKTRRRNSDQTVDSVQGAETRKQASRQTTLGQTVHRHTSRNCHSGPHCDKKAVCLDGYVKLIR